MTNCESCCKSCCYSTPFLTLSAIALVLLGLVGFIVCSVYGLAELSTIPHLQNGVVVLAPVICGMVILTLIPLIFVCVLAYFSTGYIRDILFQSSVKSCIGSNSCNVFAILLSLFYVILWLLMVIALSAILSFYVQTEILCTEATAMGRLNDSSTCIAFVDRDFNYLSICGASGDEGSDLADVCSEGTKVGLAYSIALFFSLLVVIGLILMLVMQAANFISARDHLMFRQANYPRNEAYFMKDVR